MGLEMGPSRLVVRVCDVKPPECVHVRAASVHEPLREGRGDAGNRPDKDDGGYFDHAQESDCTSVGASIDTEENGADNSDDDGTECNAVDAEDRDAETLFHNLGESGEGKDAN